MSVFGSIMSAIFGHGSAQARNGIRLQDREDAMIGWD